MRPVMQPRSRNHLWEQKTMTTLPSWNQANVHWLVDDQDGTGLGQLGSFVQLHEPCWRLRVQRPVGASICFVCFETKSWPASPSNVAMQPVPLVQNWKGIVSCQRLIPAGTLETLWTRFLSFSCAGFDCQSCHWNIWSCHWTCRRRIDPNLNYFHRQSFLDSCHAASSLPPTIFFLMKFESW